MTYIAWNDPAMALAANPHGPPGPLAANPPAVCSASVLRCMCICRTSLNAERMARMARVLAREYAKKVRQHSSYARCAASSSS
jgi:hypothetical protein